MNIETFNFNDGSEYKFAFIEKTQADNSTPVLYIGGALQNIKNIESALKEFTKKQNTIIFEFSKIPDKYFTNKQIDIDEVTKRISDILSDLGYKNINLICSSFGGIYANSITQSKLNIKKCVLAAFGPISQRGHEYIDNIINSSFINDKEVLKNQTLETLLNHGEKSNIKNFFFVRKLLSYTLSKLNEDDFKRQLLSCYTLKNKTKELKVPTCKTLCFTGEYDIFTPYSNIQDLISINDNLSIHKIKNTDHFCHIQDRKYVANLTSDFFDEK
ncbi:hypothetical protein ABMA70_02300 [Halobacteriovorax sp. XZX-3]|uniref:alpha/beta fold hydrolase n=1 Tax=unclassified Halobacteriovorax TaxID=2639665 RepID=UPI00371D337C